MADAPTPKEVWDQAVALLREGKVQEADKLLSDASAAAAADLAAASDVAEQPPAARHHLQVLVDLVHAISLQLGHPPAIAGLALEFAEAAAKVLAEAAK